MEAVQHFAISDNCEARERWLSYSTGAALVLIFNSSGEPS
jgi:hypothetical protein